MAGRHKAVYYVCLKIVPIITTNIYVFETITFQNAIQIQIALQHVLCVTMEFAMVRVWLILGFAWTMP